MKYYQQGDVLFFPINKLPKGKKARINKDMGRTVIMKGEATGHNHATEADIDFLEIKGKNYISSTKDFEVVHEEHKEVTIPAGNYKIGRVKEYDHFAEEVREVAD